MQRKQLKTKFETVQVSYAPISVNLEDLLKYKDLFIDGMEDSTDKKKIEFLVGRLCAQFDLNNTVKILKGKNSEPLWPDGMLGSISHSKDFAIAAISMDPSIKSIGIDIERIVDQRRADIVKRMTLTDEEIEYLDSHSKEFIPELATIMFSAKETLYKLINPLCGCYINFHEGLFQSFNIETGEYQIKLVSDKQELKQFEKVYKGQVYKLKNNIISIIVKT